MGGRKNRVQVVSPQINRGTRAKTGFTQAKAVSLGGLSRYAGTSKGPVRPVASLNNGIKELSPSKILPDQGKDHPFRPLPGYRRVGRREVKWKFMSPDLLRTLRHLP